MSLAWRKKAYAKKFWKFSFEHLISVFKFILQQKIKFIINEKGRHFCFSVFKKKCVCFLFLIKNIH